MFNEPLYTCQVFFPDPLTEFWISEMDFNLLCLFIYEIFNFGGIKTVLYSHVVFMEISMKNFCVSLEWEEQYRTSEREGGDMVKKYIAY